jgi:hypothetical protein
MTPNLGRAKMQDGETRNMFWLFVPKHLEQS